MFRMVIWCVCMALWLFGGGYYVFNQPGANFPAFGTGTLIPWVCVGILGWIIFSGKQVPPG